MGTATADAGDGTVSADRDSISSVSEFHASQA
jgi:hypothetical protein